jgi:hypothetical protein
VPGFFSEASKKKLSNIGVVRIYLHSWLLILISRVIFQEMSQDRQILNRYQYVNCNIGGSVGCFSGPKSICSRICFKISATNIGVGRLYLYH